MGMFDTKSCLLSQYVYIAMTMALVTMLTFCGFYIGFPFILKANLVAFRTCSDFFSLVDHFIIFSLGSVYNIEKTLVHAWSTTHIIF